MTSKGATIDILAEPCADIGVRTTRVSLADAEPAVATAVPRASAAKPKPNAQGKKPAPQDH
jgi:hypothetical protein